jgi:transcriptional regulator GlxA family with amidase domain
LLRC